MRAALTVLALVAAVLSTGCSSNRARGACGGCAPASTQCWTWQPNCCNNWDWYVPCDMVEGRGCRSCMGYEQAPVCR